MKGKLSFSVKFPSSQEFALDQRLAEPTGYGHGESDWITASFEKSVDFPWECSRTG